MKEKEILFFLKGYERERESERYFYITPQYWAISKHLNAN
jgi:hypothetical protein